MLTSICPIFPSRDFAQTRAFYQPLGFQTVAEFAEDGYLILQRDAVELHFFHAENHVPASSDHGAYVRVSDAAALSAELAPRVPQRAGIPRLIPAEDKPWGMREMAIIDIDGNLLRLGHPTPR